MKTIGLCMIVKNEARVIARCLESVRPLLDYALIVDTGSTDDTRQIIKDYLVKHNLRGEVIDQPWTNFAESRSSALAKLREKTEIDYALVVDADEILGFIDGFEVAKFKAALDKDFYHIQIRHGLITYWRPQLLNNHVEFSYRGVLYDFVAGPQTQAGAAADIFIQVADDGARSQNPNRYRDDARILEAAIDTERDAFIQARYTFYLALSWMNAGELAKALPVFLRRAELGGFEAEVPVSLYYAAGLKQGLGYSDTEIMGSFLQAYESDPLRAEPLHGAMQFCRLNNKPNQGYLIGKHALTLQQPVRAFWIAPWIYDYGLLEEFSVAAHQSGHLDDCLGALKQLLAEGKMPEDARPRIERNLAIVTGIATGATPPHPQDAPFAAHVQAVSPRPPSQ